MTTQTSRSFTTFDRALADRTLKQWRSAALRVTSAEVLTLLTPGGSIVMPVVSVVPRSDVVDLTRRHQPDLDGEGDVAYAWRFLLDSGTPRNSKAIVQCEFRNPAKCVFALEFPILDRLRFLEMTCHRNAMILQSGKGANRGITLQGIAVPELRDVVATARIIEQMEVAV